MWGVEGRHNSEACFRTVEKHNISDFKMEKAHPNKETATLLQGTRRQGGITIFAQSQSSSWCSEAGQALSVPDVGQSLSVGLQRRSFLISLEADVVYRTRAASLGYA